MNLENKSLNSGVSPVIGVILMVVITVVLGAIVANYMLAFGESSDQQNPGASTTFDQVYNANGAVGDTTILANGWTFDSNKDELTFKRDGGTDRTYEYLESEGAYYLNGDSTTITASTDGAYTTGGVSDFRLSEGVFTIEVQLTRAANIDYVQTGGAPEYVQFSSTDGDALAGSGTEDTTMDEVGDVITVENIGDGDRFNVVGSLQGNEQVLSRYEVRQR